MNQRGDLANITAPTLVIAGALDPVVPPRVAVDLQQGINGAGLLVIPAAAHLVNIEQPEAFTTAVVDHVAGPAYRRGERTRRAVVGDAHVDRSEAGATPFTEPFIDLLTRYAWGEVWTRPGLDRPTRSCITLAMLTALGRTDELELHVRGAVRNGLTADQIGEVLLHAAIYCGVPAANAAFAVAKRVLTEIGDG
jgi:3-oxoadipate enol-lactonase/4-carboxymuconolactone decarboxylase